MPYKDKNKARAYQREWARKQARKQRENASLAGKLEPIPNFKIKSPQDLKPVLEAAINEVLNAKCEPLMRGRCISQLVLTSLKLLEVSDIETRLSALETRLGG
jgi:hypothetical protein